jgi:PAS domain S-box-containing protein
MQHPQYRILLVDDEEGIRFTLGLLLKKEGYLVETASGIEDARQNFQNSSFDLAFIDIMLDDELSGLDLLREINDAERAMPVVMLTGFPQVESAAEAVRLGAFDYITKPVRYETLLAVTRHALNMKVFSDERARHRANLDAIFRTVTDVIVMIDQHGCLAQFNSPAERGCGYRHDMIGTNAADIDCGCGSGCRTALLATLHSTVPRELRRIECHPFSGEPRIVTVTATPITEPDGTISGAVAVIRDETVLVEMERSLQRRGRFHGIIGSSVPMQRVYNLIESLADVPTTVLINGESGTGKELVAAALHGSGVRSRGPFVKVNCSALSEHLLESELFGHVRGAFTGAISDKIGRFQKAHGGTLFLDEIGDISPAIQMRLLRVLQEGEFERVGDSTTIRVNVRIIAATNQSLSEMVTQGTFRQDLYYRLNVVRLDLPPLRERRDDLELLVAHFITKFNGKLSTSVTAVSDDAMNIIRAGSWPGNVRELEHAIEHACILCKTTVITADDLPQELLCGVPGSGVALEISPSMFPAAAKLSLADALAASGGNKARAARLLGVSRMTLYRQLGASD